LPGTYGSCSHQLSKVNIPVAFGACPAFADLIEMQNSEQAWPMSEMGEESPQSAPATLGDVLYAKSTASVPEQDWAALVQAIGSGDQLALHALYERAHRPVFTLMMRLTANRETAEELTIDVFHDVWRRATRYDPETGTVLGWIMNQARSRALDRLRFETRKKRTPDSYEQPQGEAAADPHDVLELRQQGESLRATLAVLTRDEREAIETTFFAGLTHAEAAVRLNQPLGTIKTRIRSGLNKLRSALGAEAGAS
jgi:RNA polymerase sigma-70 factor (ECF subfamily)